jgi:asparagine synthase (glutamine-hydrolysing)
MGGVPTPTPELQNLLARFQLRQLGRQLKVWALNQRVPWVHLLIEAIGEFLPSTLAGTLKFKRPAPWITPEFVKRNKEALRGYGCRLRFFGSLPSFQANIAALEQLRRQVSCSTVPSDPVYETRYPYLDRDLLEFIYSIPRSQLVRAGQRRSLMRRSLLGLVPSGILDRKRKAFVARRPRVAILAEWDSVAELTRNMSSASIGVIDQDKLLNSLQKVRNNEDVPVVHLMRAICSEIWLKNLRAHGIELDADNRSLMRPISRRHP